MHLSHRTKSVGRGVKPPLGLGRLLAAAFCLFCIGACGKTAPPKESSKPLDTSSSQGDTKAAKTGETDIAQAGDAQGSDNDAGGVRELSEILRARAEKARIEKEAARKVHADTDGTDKIAEDSTMEKKIRIRYKTPIVQGSFSAAELGKVIKSRNDQLVACGAELPKDKSFGMGRVEIKFIISGTGAVQMATIISSKIKTPEIENCLSQTIRSFTFPKPKGGGIGIVKLSVLVSPI